MKNKIIQENKEGNEGRKYIIHQTASPDPRGPAQRHLFCYFVVALSWTHPDQYLFINYPLRASFVI